MTFHGDAFTTNADMIHVKSLMLDFFRGQEEDHVDLAGLEHVISFTAVNNNNSSSDNQQAKLFLRVYRISLFKSTSKLPRVEVKEMGPRLDLILRRTRWADDQRRKLALRQPAELKVRGDSDKSFPSPSRVEYSQCQLCSQVTKVKNVERNPIGDKFGRIHLGKQDLSKLQTRKMKGLKRSHGDIEADADEEEEEEEVNDAGGNKRVALSS